MGWRITYVQQICAGFIVLDFETVTANYLRVRGALRWIPWGLEKQLSHLQLLSLNPKPRNPKRQALNPTPPTLAFWKRPGI